MMTAQERRARANAARRILDDPLVAETFSALEREYLKRWVESGFADRDGREELHRYVHVLRQFRAQFEAMVADGDVVEHQAAQRPVI